MDASGEGGGERHGLGVMVALVLGLLVLALHVPGLDGPFRDGQRGNCGAMFALFARNAEVLGWLETGGVPVVNPVPPAPGERRVYYTHHPPGLPWAVQLSRALPLSVETSSRLVALVATLASVLLAADIASRLAGRRAAWAAGLGMAALPAGLHHGLLVNYETVALPGMLLLVRSVGLGVGRPWLAALFAGLADWIALVPLAFLAPGLVGGPDAARRRWWSAAGVGGAVVVASFAHGRLMAPGATVETGGQALLATFLNPEFSWGAWWQALSRHVDTLFGPAAVIAALGIPAWVGSPAARRVLLALLGTGLLNVVLFAHHATGHEHFSLPLLPVVALSMALLLFPRRRLSGPRAALGVLLLAGVLGRGLLATHEAAPMRQRISQARRADALAAATTLDRVYVTPTGVPFVFLHRAARHVSPYPVDSVDAARAAAATYTQRFGTAALPLSLFVDAGSQLPDWLATLPPPREARGLWIWDLPAD